MLSSQYASITVEEFTGGVLHLRYGGIAGGDCEAHVLLPENLETLIGEAFIGKTSGVTAVHVSA